MQLYQLLMPSPVGQLKLIAHEHALVAICWLDDSKTPYAGHEYHEDVSHHILLQAQSELEAYFNQQLETFLVPFSFWQGTLFQKRVWEKLNDIPFGETVSYAWMANAIGQPTAVRAVASAIGHNPLSIIVPCHRVIASNGTLGGFASGLENKKILLNLETNVQK